MGEGRPPGVSLTHQRSRRRGSLDGFDRPRAVAPLFLAAVRRFVRSRSGGRPRARYRYVPLHTAASTSTLEPRPGLSIPTATRPGPPTVTLNISVPPRTLSL